MIADVLSDAGARMQRAVEAAREEFALVRTGRANPQLFQKITVSYYGTPTPLAQLASIQNADARSIVITPYDRAVLKDIEQAIRDNPNLGANPTNDGSIVRVTLPELTEERRREFAKLVRQKAEDARVAVRNVRRKAKDDLEALKSEVGENDVVRAEKELETLTKTHVDHIDEAVKRKEAELLEV